MQQPCKVRNIVPYNCNPPGIIQDAPRNISYEHFLMFSGRFRYACAPARLQAVQNSACGNASHRGLTVVMQAQARAAHRRSTVQALLRLRWCCALVATCAGQRQRCGWAACRRGCRIVSYARSAASTGLSQTSCASRRRRTTRHLSCLPTSGGCYTCKFRHGNSAALQLSSAALHA